MSTASPVYVLVDSQRIARFSRVWRIAREIWGSDQEAREFLFCPHTMLEGRPPAEIAMGTDAGAKRVEDILGRLIYGTAV